MQTPAKASQHGKRWRRLASGLAVAAVLGGAAAAYLTLSGPGVHQGTVEARNSQRLAPLPPPAGSQIRGATLPNFTALVARTRPAVVSIATRLTPQASRRAMEHGSATDFPRTNGSADAPAPAMEAPRGSGFIIGADGTIVTNNHLVAGERSILVTLYDGSKLPATVLGRDRRNDIALLKSMPAIRFRLYSSEIRVPVRPGAWVIAIGNPFGLGDTVTRGIRLRRAAPDRQGPGGSVHPDGCADQPRHPAARCSRWTARCLAWTPRSCPRPAVRPASASPSPPT